MFLVYLNLKHKLITHPVIWDGANFTFDRIDERHIICGCYIDNKKYLLPGLRPIETYSHFEFLDVHFLQDSDFAFRENLTFSKSDLSQLLPAPLTENIAINAPTMYALIPDSTTPGSTGNFLLKGSGYTPTMSVLVEGQTVNYITFISTTEIYVNMTAGLVDGYFDVTLNNGFSATFVDALALVYGVVISPKTIDYVLTEPINVVNDEINVQTYNSLGVAQWSQIIDFTKNFYIRFKLKATPLGLCPTGETVFLNLLNSVDVSVLSLSLRRDAGVGYKIRTVTANEAVYATPSYPDGSPVTNNDAMIPYTNSYAELRWVDGLLYFYFKNVLTYTYVFALTENLKFKFSVKTFDIFDIKYIELT